jgi:parallel beta-helix repeat protein
VRRCRARAGQNGLVLERCDHARVYDDDFSFLSGWGIALWRSSDNVLARNACDFCIRGFSHGVYNRGQDSAGILLFEQCSRNVIAENSATHCGDGFFSFAGQEALGGVPPPTSDFDYVRKGCNDNRIHGNDLSYAAAHGLELTFSFGNQIRANRLVGNAICGIWAGYSQRDRHPREPVRENGSAGVGQSAAGSTSSTARRTRSRPTGSRATSGGIHLWWGRGPGAAGAAWMRANGDDSAGLRPLEPLHARRRGDPGARTDDAGRVEQHDQRSRDRVPGGPRGVSASTPRRARCRARVSCRVRSSPARAARWERASRCAGASTSAWASGARWSRTAA